MKRVDGRNAIDLLTRALALSDGEARELECALGTAYKFAGNTTRAETLLGDLNARSREAGDARIEHLARIELVWPRLARGEVALDEVDDLLERSFGIFDADDDWARGRAWHCRAVVDAVYRLRYAELEAAVERLQLHYERSGFARGSALFLFATAAYRGPTPARDAIDRCNVLLEEAGTPFWRSFILPVLAVVEAMDERFDTARAHLIEARSARQEFPEGGALETSWAGLAAEVDLLAGDLEHGEELLLDACAALRAAGEREWLATNTALLAEVLYRQGRFEEALALSAEALGHAPPGHLTSGVVARRVRAKALAQTGELDEAIALASETIDLLATTRVLDEQGEGHAALAEAYALAGLEGEADEAWERARTCFERKGNRVSEARARRMSLSRK